MGVNQTGIERPFDKVSSILVVGLRDLLSQIYEENGAADVVLPNHFMPSGEDPR